jgi:hypothetical protein
MPSSPVSSSTRSEFKRYVPFRLAEAIQAQFSTNFLLLQNKKYMASQLPHEFETKAQYERSLRMPIGPEWSTKETYQASTKPRVMIKQGIIKPLEKPIL